MLDWSVIRWLLGKLLKLPIRTTRLLEIERDIPVAMRDGVELLSDRYFPKGQSSGPVVLIRSSYGRGAIFGVIAGLLAERGLQVVVQSVRGTTGSAGTLNPMRQEQADGADALKWIRKQPWFSGKLFTFGFSYLGNVQWAMAHGAAENMDGLVLMMTLSNFRDELQSFGGFTQAGTLGWTELMLGMVDFVPGQKMKRPKAGSLDHVQGHLPLGAMDQVAFGKTVSWWQDWVNHVDPDDPWWQAIDHSHAAVELPAPATMIAGWQDIFLPFQIKDFAARQAVGREDWLTIGPWSHVSHGGMAEGLRQAITFFSALATGEAPNPHRKRVRLYLQGANKWLEYSSWPPPGGQPLRFYLAENETLQTVLPLNEGSMTYLYDPADPTPAVHGPSVTGGAKVRTMTALEQRSDAITFTSASFDRDLSVIGPVSVELSVRSDREHTDFYVCLCDVDKKGRSLQVVDGYLRLRPDKPAADSAGIRRIAIECWPTAYQFKSGHRLRLIVASGAHPRYARNLGTGEPLATATRMVAAQQEVLFGAGRDSSINLLELANA